MQITSVQIYPTQSTSGLVGFASVIVDDWLRLTGIGIHKRFDGQGYRLTYPTKRPGLHDTNLFHPISKPGSQLIEKAIFEAYKAVIESCNDRHCGINPSTK
jgi:DNA-binding cell septation regulator SpoVG